MLTNGHKSIQKVWNSLMTIRDISKLDKTKCQISPSHVTQFPGVLYTRFHMVTMQTLEKCIRLQQIVRPRKIKAHDFPESPTIGQLHRYWRRNFIHNHFRGDYFDLVITSMCANLCCPLFSSKPQDIWLKVPTSFKKYTMKIRAFLLRKFAVVSQSSLLCREGIYNPRFIIFIN